MKVVEVAPGVWVRPKRVLAVKAIETAIAHCPDQCCVVMDGREVYVNASAGEVMAKLGLAVAVVDEPLKERPKYTGTELCQHVSYLGAHLPIVVAHGGRDYDIRGVHLERVAEDDYILRIDGGTLNNNYGETS